MSEVEAVPFIIGRGASPLITVKIPVTAAIVTMMFLGGSRHHPAACAVVGELAMVISDSQLEDNLDGSLITGAEKIREGLSDNRHHPEVSRFINDGNIIYGFIHPMELYAMAISCEGFLDDIDEEEQSIYQSLNTWARAASRFVNDREMLAIYAPEVKV